MLMVFMGGNKSSELLMNIIELWIIFSVVIEFVLSELSYVTCCMREKISYILYMWNIDLMLKCVM